MPTTTKEPVSILPPTKESFDGATRLSVGPEIQAIVDRVLAFDEFKDLVMLPSTAIWYRKRKLVDGMPVFAFAKKWDDDAVWYAERVLKQEQYPRWRLGLNWLNFDDLREEGSFVVDTTLERHIYLAFMGIQVSESEQVTKRAPAIQTWHEAVKRYGAYDTEMVRLQGILKLELE